MTAKRLILDCALDKPIVLPPKPKLYTMRRLTYHDIPSLAALMLAAYRGTVDDQGETEEDALSEVKATLDGRYGDYLEVSSLGLWRGEDLISAVVTTLFKNRPLFAFCMTTPPFKRMGYCRFLMRQSQHVLQLNGWDFARLYVTATNVPALGLYRQIGFLEADVEHAIDR